MNPELSVSSTGGGNAVSLKTGSVPVMLRFAADVQGARDERTGKSLGDGAEFTFDWARNEAIVVSFGGSPPR